MTRRILLTFLGAAPLSLADGDLLLRARTRKHGMAVEDSLFWKIRETAVIICDMWDDHYCKSSARRVREIAPRMNEAVRAARTLGVQIVHAPSGTMNVYADTPQRKRMIEARKTVPPVPIAKWCYHDEKSEGPLPIDDATEPCDDEVVGEKVRRYNKQNDLIDIAEPDGISDNGEEIYNFFQQQGIRNVVLMGVHLNMCVLGRPFGIRQMVRLGRNVVLARDLTDSMYDPRQRPWVDHARGTELMVEHTEKYWCPSILSKDLTRRVS